MRKALDQEISILAVCTGNICRSPMAEGILRGMLSACRDITISSAGTHAVEGNPASEFAVIASFEQGVDISGHRARVLTPDMIKRSHVILCMEPSHIEWVISADVHASERVFNVAKFSGGKKRNAIDDPYGCSLREYRQCFLDLRLCLDNFIGREKGYLFRR